MKVVTAYTPNYRPYFDRMAASIRRQHVKLIDFCFADRGSWVENCSTKPDHIRTAMDNTDHDGLLWIDADAIAWHIPEWLIDQIDSKAFDVHIAKRANGEILSGTLGVSRTPHARRFLNAWYALCKEQTDVWDQRHIEAALERIEGISVGELPPEACFIFDSMRKEMPDAQPFIEHFQASRIHNEQRTNRS